MQSLLPFPFDSLLAAAPTLAVATPGVLGSGATQTQLLTFILIAFPVFFGGMWFGVLNLLSATGGWRRLGKRFPARVPAQGRGDSYPMQSGMVGWASYKGVLNIHTTPEGIHLSLFALFRPGHPPLFIPWEEVFNATPVNLFWKENMKFEVGSPAMATVQLPRKVFEPASAL